MSRWHLPVDPSCPEVREWKDAIINDPMTSHYGAPVDEFVEDFERRHVTTCAHCKVYGAANIEIAE